MSRFRRVASIALAVLAMGTLVLAGEAQKVTGKVKAVSGNAVTLVADDGAEHTFEVTAKTKVVGVGCHHKADALQANGRKAGIGEFVRADQRVSVRYLEEKGARYIEALRIL
jgi:hypothetical protein